MKTSRRGFLVGLFGAAVGAALPKKAQGMEANKRFPLLYTDHEGGQWQEWPRNMPVTDADLSRRSNTTVLISGRRVHSLRFWTRKGEFVGWKRWNCVNGWNRGVVNASFMPTADTPPPKHLNHGVLERMTADGLDRKRRRKRK